MSEERFGVWAMTAAELSHNGEGGGWLGRDAASDFIGTMAEASRKRERMAAAFSWCSYEVRPYAEVPRKGSYSDALKSRYKPASITCTTSLCTCCTSAAFRMFVTDPRIEKLVATRAERPEDRERVQRVAWGRDEGGVRSEYEARLKGK